MKYVRSFLGRTEEGNSKPAVMLQGYPEGIPTGKFIYINY
jgi:hypothetical protein